MGRLGGGREAEAAEGGGEKEFWRECDPEGRARGEVAEGRVEVSAEERFVVVVRVTVLMTGRITFSEDCGRARGGGDREEPGVGR